MEPFPISLRLLSWVKFLALHQVEDEGINRSLWWQINILRDNLEFHLLGNHLLENGFGLLFGAFHFADKRTYQLAKKLLERELEEQVLPDGAHFELSPMYHQLMLHRVLDSFNLVKNNPGLFGPVLLPLLEKKAAGMLGWLSQMTFRDGQIPMFNDSTGGVAPTTEELTGYARSLGIATVEKPLKESGYRHYAFPTYELIVDVGHIGPDYIPGHAHSDTFNFEMHLNGKPFIVDTGISTYEKDGRRQKERSTSSHNTVQVGQHEQSEVWGGFRVGRRASPLIVEESKSSITASHDGYARFGINHTRTFQCHDSKLVIEDNFSGAGLVPSMSGTAYFHFHPSIHLSQEGDDIRSSLGLIKLEKAHAIKIDSYEYCLGFNKTEPGQLLAVTFQKELKTTIAA